MTIELVIGMDGNAWFCHGPDFINLQESEVEFGETEEEAVMAYLKQYINRVYS